MQNKSWRTNRHKLSNLASEINITRRWAHIKRYAENMNPFKRLFGKAKSGDPISWISGENPEMQSAIKKAQDSFSEFHEAILKDAHRIVPCVTESLVKYAFPLESGRVAVEHMFISDFEFEGSEIYGHLASESKYIKTMKAGDRIKIEKDRVTDWLLVTPEGTEGGYTFLVMWSAFSHQERELYGQHPPFCWLEGRLA